MTDLLAAVITLEPTAPVGLDPFQGRALHAIFLDLTRRAQPDMAARLHDGDGPKPFTSSNLLGMGRGPRGRATVMPGAALRWRVTTFEPALTALWRERVLPALPATVTVGEATLAVTGYTTDAAADEWAGESSFTRLALRHTLDARPPAPWINLRFASPTAFRTNDMHVPLPLPGLLVGSWLDKWNAFAPLSLADDARRVAEQDVMVNRYELRTEPVQFGPATIIGFTGLCGLAVRCEDPYWRRIPHLLAAFSFWCGTGHRAPYGLGQTRVL